jgi:phenylalanyl-tRNA synthetase beta subunit
VPSLLEKIHPNIKAGYDQFGLFEIGKAHVLNEPDSAEPEIPKEVNSLSFVYAAKKAKPGAAYYVTRKYLINLLANFQAKHSVGLEKLAGADLYKNPWLEQMAAPFEPGRSAVLRDKNGLVWGVVGEFKASVRKALKLPEYCAGFEMDPLLLLQPETLQNYIALPRFPKVTQDITLKVMADLPYQELHDFLAEKTDKTKPKNTLLNLNPRGIFQRDDDKGHKQITFRLEIASYERTLTDPEVNKLLDQVAAAAKEKFGAERV